MALFVDYSPEARAERNRGVIAALIAEKSVPHPQAASLGPSTPTLLELEQAAISANYRTMEGFAVSSPADWRRAAANARRLMYRRPLSNEEIAAQVEADTAGGVPPNIPLKTDADVLAEQTQEADRFLAFLVGRLPAEQSDVVLSARIKLTVMLAVLNTQREHNDPETGIPPAVLDMLEGRYRAARATVDQELRRRGML